MKVLQVTNVDMTVSKLLLPLVEGLQGKGYEVDVVCKNEGFSDDLRGKGFRLIEVAFKRSPFALSNIRAFSALLSIVRSNKYDVIHFHTPIISFYGRICCLLSNGTPTLIYTAHGFYFHENMRSTIKFFMIYLEKILGRLTTDWLFTQSLEDAIYARRKMFLKEVDQIVWISNGVDVRKFRIERNRKLKESFGIQEDEKVVGFIGRLVKEKGIFDLADAFREIASACDDARLLIVGETLDSDRDRNVKEALVERFKEYGISDKVIFTGFRHDIPQVISIMDIFVLPSYREGMPRTIIEAMAGGKPVVATDIRGSREEVINWQTGILVPVNDCDALAMAIETLLEDDDLRKKMGKAAWLRALERFDETKVVNKQLDIYESIDCKT